LKLVKMTGGVRFFLLSKLALGGLSTLDSFFVPARMTSSAGSPAVPTVSDCFHPATGRLDKLDRR
jgi:hypothetical protein